MNINIDKKYKIFIVAIILCIVIIVTGICFCVHYANNYNDDITTTNNTTENTAQENTEKEKTTENITEDVTADTTQNITTGTFDEQKWNLMLVNPWNKIPSEYADSIELTQLKNGHAVDSRCYPDLQKMLDDCRASGFDPVICSSFRTQKTQESLYDRKIKQFESMGYSTEDAKIEAGRVVAVPGTSEHQLGLAVDIVDSSYKTLDEKQETTPAQKWLMQNSYKYGWILRYPNSKKDITGIIYEPWHYRYVGKEAAEEIYNSGVCLEEYLQKLNN